MRSLRMAASWQLGGGHQGAAPDPATWRHLASCADQDPDLFFPVGGGAPALVQTRRAKAVCARCPVRDACLEWANATQQPHGVWGGLDERERELLRGGYATSTVSELDGPAPVARSA